MLSAPRRLPSRLIPLTDEELDRVATDGLDSGELDRVRVRLLSAQFRELDAVLSRTLAFAKFGLVHGDPGLVAALPGRLAGITEADVRSAAAALQPNTRAVVELIAGGAK